MMIWEQRRDKGYISRFGGMVVNGDEKISLTCIQVNSKKDEKRGQTSPARRDTQRDRMHTTKRKQKGRAKEKKEEYSSTTK